MATPTMGPTTMGLWIYLLSIYLLSIYLLWLPHTIDRLTIDLLRTYLLLTYYGQCRVQALTSTDDTEIAICLRQLKASAAGTHSTRIACT